MLTPPRSARHDTNVTHNVSNSRTPNAGGGYLSVQESTKIQHLSAEIRIARESERALNRASAVLGIAAAASSRFGAAGATLGLVLGVGSGASAFMASSAGDQAEKLEAKLEAEKSAAPPPPPATPGTKKKPPPRQNDEAAIRRIDTFGRGDTFGGRASAHDPVRTDAISRTC